ncbi:MAG: gamma carbonic anhydrase family protein [Desulfobacterales bacterium]|nr:gamma carbonic anhydrase family protein [Desulfobacterales bacterium]
MIIIEYKGKKPKIGNNVFIAPNATIIGNVEISDNSSVWYGAVIRGDLDLITIGSNTNIQDNCTVHTDYGKPTIIGNNVTIGHNAVVHGCTIEDNCLIGFNAGVLNGAIIKKNSVVAAGSVVKEGQIVGPYHLVAGVPSTLKKELSKEIGDSLELPAKVYCEIAKEHAINTKIYDFY